MVPLNLVNLSLENRISNPTPTGLLEESKNVGYIYSIFFKKNADDSKLTPKVNDIMIY